MKSKTALVRTDSAVELDTEATVYLCLTVIVNPSNSEHELSFRLCNSFDNSVFLILRILLENWFERVKNLSYCLNKFRLSRVLGLNFFKLFTYI